MRRTVKVHDYSKIDRGDPKSRNDLLTKYIPETSSILLSHATGVVEEFTKIQKQPTKIYKVKKDVSFFFHLGFIYLLLIDR